MIDFNLYLGADGEWHSLPDYSECARRRGFTCILGTGCDRTPICPRPGCAAQDDASGVARHD